MMRTNHERTLAMFWDWSLAHLLVAAHKFDEYAQAVVRQRKDDFEIEVDEPDAADGAGDGSVGGGDGTHYNPNEPRVPAGNPNGGQWTSGVGDYPDAIEPVYPIESVLGALTGGEALAALKELSSFWEVGSATVDSGYSEIADAIEEYFGGAPQKILPSKKGDIIMMGSDKKIRFDMDGHGYDPHFHLEQLDENGDWVDIGNQHMYFFDKE